MKKRLVFMNLSIDSLWDSDGTLREIFNVEIPESTALVRANENLALYMCDAQDTLLCSPDLSQDFIDYLGAMNVPVPEVLRIDKNPYHTDEWLTEVKNKLSHRTFDSTLFVATSDLEQKLSHLLHIDLQYPAEFYQQYNRKDWLVDYCKRENILLPQTKVLKTHQLRELNSDAMSNFLYKYVFSSGGGGTFEFNSPLMLNALLRKVEKTDGFWLQQEKLDVMKDFSFDTYINHAGPSSIGACAIQYDQHNLSFQHQDISIEMIPREIQNRFVKLTDHFRGIQYTGPIGVDAICTKTGDIYPFTDLNLRFTKTHLIRYAAKRFGLPSGWIHYRYRTHTAANLSFSSWWKSVCNRLSLNEKGRDPFGYQLLPVLWVHTNHLPNVKHLVEVSFFISHSEQNNETLQDWVQRTQFEIQRSFD